METDKCPTCGLRSNAYSLKHKTPPILCNFGGCEWIESHTCTNCGTQFTTKCGTRFTIKNKTN